MGIFYFKYVLYAYTQKNHNFIHNDLYYLLCIKKTIWNIYTGN